MRSLELPVRVSKRSAALLLFSLFLTGALLCVSLLVLRAVAYERRQNRAGRNSASHGAPSVPNASHEVASGMDNVERLLPLARHLSLEALREQARQYRIKPSELELAERNINAVRRIVLDQELGDRAEVDDDVPEEIRIGAEYAEYLGNDEDAVLLLGHELTHAAARHDNLTGFVQQITANAEREAGVRPTEDQQEDLACDFIGAQVLKTYVRRHPSRESERERLARALDYENGDEPDAEGDEEHLSERETLRAILALDPELRRLLDGS